MERGVRHRVSIIGAGNVATHLAQALACANDVVQIYSRNIANAACLASKIKGCEAIDDIAKLSSNVDIYVVSVKDDAIKDIAVKMPVACRNGLWVHTSGSVSMNVFSNVAESYGVLYPLQTFSRDVAVNVGEVPFFIEGNNAKTLEKIKEVALSVSPIVRCADSDSRKRIHASAVFACNFVNHMWSMADDVLNEGDFSFSLLLPLLKETLAKVAKVSPSEAQTGPARRGDIDTMTGHLALLDEDKKEIYKLLSRSIMKQYNISTNEQNKL